MQFGRHIKVHVHIRTVMVINSAVQFRKSLYARPTATEEIILLQIFLIARRTQRQMVDIRSGRPALHGKHPVVEHVHIGIRITWVACPSEQVSTQLLRIVRHTTFGNFARQGVTQMSGFPPMFRCQRGRRDGYRSRTAARPVHVCMPPLEDIPKVHGRLLVFFFARHLVTAGKAIDQHDMRIGMQACQDVLVPHQRLKEPGRVETSSQGQMFGIARNAVQFIEHLIHGSCLILRIRLHGVHHPLDAFR